MKQYYKDVSQRLEIEDEAAQQQDGDDDEIQMGGSNTGAAPNATCPYSGKPVSAIVGQSNAAQQFAVMCSLRLLSSVSSAPLLLRPLLPCTKLCLAARELCITKVCVYLCRFLSWRILLRTRKAMCMSERPSNITSEKREVL